MRKVCRYLSVGTASYPSRRIFINTNVRILCTNSRVFKRYVPSTGWTIQLRRPTRRSMQDKDNRQHSIRADVL